MASNIYRRTAPRGNEALYVSEKGGTHFSFSCSFFRLSKKELVAPGISAQDFFAQTEGDGVIIIKS